MRYFGTFTIKTDSRQKMMAKYNAVQDERKKFPELYPERLTLKDGSYANARISVMNGHILYEGTEDQMIRLAVRYFPEMEFTFVPCLDPAKIQAAFYDLG